MVTPVIWQECGVVTIETTKSEVQMIMPDVGALAHHILGTSQDTCTSMGTAPPGCHRN